MPAPSEWPVITRRHGPLGDGEPPLPPLLGRPPTAPPVRVSPRGDGPTEEFTLSASLSDPSRSGLLPTSLHKLLDTRHIRCCEVMAHQVAARTGSSTRALAASLTSACCNVSCGTRANFILSAIVALSPKLQRQGWIAIRGYEYICAVEQILRPYVHDMGLSHE